MAIELRSGGRIFHFGYAGKHPATGTTIRAYYGLGPMAEWLAQLDAEHRAERRRRIAEEQEERQQILGAARLSCQAIEAAKQVLVAELNALGYHQHARGIWRQSRTCDASIRGAERSAFQQAAMSANLATDALFELLGGTDSSTAKALNARADQIRSELLEQGNSLLEQTCVGRLLVCAVEAEVVSLRALKTTEMSATHAAFFVQRRRVANNGSSLPRVRCSPCGGCLAVSLSGIP